MFIKTYKRQIFLLLFLLPGFLIACKTPAPAATTPEAPPIPPDRVDVVYFYDSEICHCQIVPGDQIQSALFINFGGEEASGKLTYRSIDLTDANNAAIVSKYGATSQMLFIDLVRGDSEQIVAVPEILLLKDDEEALGRLVVDRVQQYLAGNE